MASALVGGMYGADGRQSSTCPAVADPAPGLFAGLFAPLAFVALGRCLAAGRRAAGLAVVVSARACWIGRVVHRPRQTILDFAVIATAVLVALSVGGLPRLARASRWRSACSCASRWLAPSSSGARWAASDIPAGAHHAERSILEAQGGQSAIFERRAACSSGRPISCLGALGAGFGIAALASCWTCAGCKMVDLTAAYMLRRKSRTGWPSGGAGLLFSAVPETRPAVGTSGAISRPSAWSMLPDTLRIFDDVDDAPGMDRGRVDCAGIDPAGRRRRWSFCDMDLSLPVAGLQTLAGPAGQHGDAASGPARPRSGGDGGDEIYLIRRGVVRIQWPLDTGAQPAPGQFLTREFLRGDVFLDHQPDRSDAVAFTDCELFVLSRQRYDTLVAHHKLLWAQPDGRPACLLASCWRHTDAELRALQTS